MSGRRVQAGELKEFVGVMERELRKVGAPPIEQKQAFLDYQNMQFDKLVEMEATFRDKLIALPKAEEIFGKFFDHIGTLGSILSARPFFRERQDTFTAGMSALIRTRDWRNLAKYRINYRFIRWACSTKMLGGQFSLIKRRVEKLRQQMILLLLPLAISRARIFASRTPASHLSFLDLAQISFEGSFAAVDKFVPPFSDVYRAVAIGRITSNLIDQYSDTMLHFYPNDRKVLYRANKVVGKTPVGNDGVNFDAVADRLNKDDPTLGVESITLARLMSAASHVSSDATVGGIRKTVSRMVAPEEDSPDQRAEKSEALGLMRSHWHKLRLVERKFLVLKGILPVEALEGDDEVLRTADSSSAD